MSEHKHDSGKLRHTPKRKGRVTVGSHRVLGDVNENLRIRTAAIATTGGVATALFFFLQPPGHGSTTLPTTMIHLPAWSSLVVASLAALSGIMRRRSGQWVQLVMFFSAAALTLFGHPSDPVGMVFLALALMYGIRYRRNLPRFRDVFLVTLTVLVGTWILYIIVVAEGFHLHDLVSITTAAATLTMFLMVVNDSDAEEAEHRRLLEETVTARTNDLIDSLSQAQALQEHNAHLVSEVHHRTRNNLQIVNSLLSMEMYDLPSPQAQTMRLGKAMERRIHMMTVAHDLFHKTHHAGHGELKGCINALLDAVVANGTIRSSELSCDQEIRNEVTIDFVVPLALLIGEAAALAHHHEEHAPTSSDHGVPQSHIQASVWSVDTQVGITVEWAMGRTPSSYIAVEWNVVEALAAQLNGRAHHSPTAERAEVQIPVP